MRKIIIASSALILIGALSVYSIQQHEPVNEPVIAGNDSPAGDVLASSPAATNRPVFIPDLSMAREAPAPSAEDYMAEMIMRIQQQFGETIQNVAVQVGLKEFRDDLIRGYPGQGAQMFEQIIRAAFPELADLILERIALMDRYEEWLLAAMPDLNRMDLAEQQNTLWEQRLALFGDDAKMIWTRELSAEEERNESVRTTVAMLDRAYDVSMDERLYLLQNAFKENYAQSMSGLVYDTTSVMSQVFFRFDSVQQELASLPNEERQEQINEIRRKMGYPEEAVASLAEQDQQKEARWQNGYAYMQERLQLESKPLAEEELQARVAQLREKYFGEEAYTISKEEDELGFFRYERPRVYGWN